MKRNKFLSGIRLKTIIILVLFMLYYFGAFTHIFELDYNEEFDYPLNVDVPNCIKNITKCDIINKYDFDFILTNKVKCQTKNPYPIRLVIIVKSAVNNFQRRTAIRNSWGHEKRFSDVVIRTVFILGISHESSTLEVQVENEKYGDIIQVNFVDTYYNNTFKMMMSFKWLVSFCNNAKFYLFIDDDMYLSVKNLLRFLRNPTEYPNYLKFNNSLVSNIIYYDIPESTRLFAGSVAIATPQRHMCSKWYVPLAEYPFSYYPPYAHGGAIILSKEALYDLYYASLFSKHFRFDDIYLGILAKRVNIEPFNCDQFYMYKQPYNKHDYKYTIVSHGYGRPNDLLHIWNEQKSLGNA